MRNVEVRSADVTLRLRLPAAFMRRTEQTTTDKVSLFYVAALINAGAQRFKFLMSLSHALGSVDGTRLTSRQNVNGSL